MFRQAIDIVRNLLFLSRDMSQTKSDLAKLKEELVDTNDAVRQIAFELQRLNERERAEREKLILTLENKLLRYERDIRSISNKKNK